MGYGFAKGLGRMLTANNYSPWAKQPGTGISSPSLLSKEQEAALNKLMPQLQAKINPDYAAAENKFQSQIENPAINYMNTTGMQGIASRGSLHSTANQNAVQELGDSTNRMIDVQRGQAMENERQGSKGYIQALLGALGTKTKENILDKQSFMEKRLGMANPLTNWK